MYSDWEAFVAPQMPRVALLVYVAKVEKIEDQFKQLPRHLRAVDFDVDTYRQL